MASERSGSPWMGGWREPDHLQQSCLSGLTSAHHLYFIRYLLDMHLNNLCYSYKWLQIPTDSYFRQRDSTPKSIHWENVTFSASSRQHRMICTHYLITCIQPTTPPVHPAHKSRKYNSSPEYCKNATGPHLPSHSQQPMWSNYYRSSEMCPPYDTPP